jgi:hypothetical protein
MAMSSIFCNLTEQPFSFTSSQVHALVMPSVRASEQPVVGGLDLEFEVTFWDSVYAESHRTPVEMWSLNRLEPLIWDTNAPDKKALPLLTLSKFGDKRTQTIDKETGDINDGSQRNAANVEFITGIEADYDDEQVGIEDAKAKLEAAGILAMVYTSPSHTEDAPRWRVLCPTSRPLDPEQKATLVARLNGVLGGVLADESFKLAQAYYYGSVRANPSHTVVLIEGKPIDELSALDECAIGKRSDRGKTLNGAVAATASDYGPLAEDETDIKAALDIIPNDGPHDWERWNGIGMAVWTASAGSDYGLGCWEEWSARNQSEPKRGAKQDSPSSRRKHWRDSSPPNGSKGFGSLVHLARQADQLWNPPSWRKNVLVTDEGAAGGTAATREKAHIMVQAGEVGSIVLLRTLHLIWLSPQPKSACSTASGPIRQRQNKKPYRITDKDRQARRLPRSRYRSATGQHCHLARAVSSQRHPDRSQHSSKLWVIESRRPVSLL